MHLCDKVPGNQEHNESKSIPKNNQEHTKINQDKQIKMVSFPNMKKVATSQ